MLQKAYPLIGRTLIAPHTHSFSIDCPDMAALARPGQFVHVRLPGFLLRRPISVCQITQDGLRIVVEERGAGTEEMARLGSGDLIDLLGPLGNGFLTEAPHRRAVLVGGGIGTPPLLPLAEHYHKAEVFLGFRSADRAILTEDFEAAGATVTLATEDGSAGHHGYVTEPLEQHLARHGADVLYACGPEPMLKAVQALAAKYHVTAYLSLEARMACGVGACLGCAVPILTAEGVVYRHVCKDGPVFPAEEVVL